jgi:hypothetical protein
MFSDLQPLVAREETGTETENSSSGYSSLDDQVIREWPDKYEFETALVGEGGLYRFDLGTSDTVVPYDASAEGLFGQTEFIKEIEEYQRQCLKTFTTRELIELVCISDRQLKPSTLRNGILPVFADENWRINFDNPMLKRDGYYRLDAPGSSFCVPPGLSDV